MSTENLTYNQAIEELTDIVSKIGSDNYDVDMLTENVKRGAELIKFCKEKLKKVEVDVSEALKAIEDTTLTNETDETKISNDTNDFPF